MTVGPGYHSIRRHGSPEEAEIKVLIQFTQTIFRFGIGLQFPIPEELYSAVIWSYLEVEEAKITVRNCCGVNALWSEKKKAAKKNQG